MLAYATNRKDGIGFNNKPVTVFRCSDNAILAEYESLACCAKKVFNDKKRSNKISDHVTRRSKRFLAKNNIFKVDIFIREKGFDIQDYISKQNQFRYAKRETKSGNIKDRQKGKVLKPACKSKNKLSKGGNSTC